MLHTITKRLERCIDVNIKISEVDHYMCIFTSRIFRFALKITFLLNRFFFDKCPTIYCHILENLISVGWRRGVLIRAEGF